MPMSETQEAIYLAWVDKIPELSPSEVQEAITVGVQRAIGQLLKGATGMPSHDFWDMMERSLKEACGNIRLTLEQPAQDDEDDHVEDEEESEY